MTFKKKILNCILGFAFIGALASCANNKPDDTSTTIKEIKFEDVVEKVEVSLTNPSEINKANFLNTKSLKLMKENNAGFALTINQEIKIKKIEFDYCYDELIRIDNTNSMCILYTTTNERLSEMKNKYEVGAYEDNKTYHVVLTDFEEPVCKKDGKIRIWLLVNGRNQSFEATISNFTVTLQQ